jgi:hypothetical protein
LNFFLPARFFGVVAANRTSSLENDTPRAISKFGSDIVWEEEEGSDDMGCEEEEELLLLLLPVNIFICWRLELKMVLRSREVRIENRVGVERLKSKVLVYI